MKVRIHNPTGKPFDTDITDEAGNKFSCVSAYRIEDSGRSTDGARAELTLYLIPYDIRASVVEVSVTVPLPVGLEADAGVELELRSLITNYFAEKLKGK